MLVLQRQCSCNDSTVAGQEAQAGEKEHGSVTYLKVPHSVHKMPNGKFPAFLSEHQIGNKYKTGA